MSYNYLLGQIVNQILFLTIVVLVLGGFLGFFIQQILGELKRIQCGPSGRGHHATSTLTIPPA